MRKILAFVVGILVLGSVGGLIAAQIIISPPTPPFNVTYTSVKQLNFSCSPEQKVYICLCSNPIIDPHITGYGNITATRPYVNFTGTYNFDGTCYQGFAENYFEYPLGEEPWPYIDDNLTTRLNTEYLKNKTGAVAPVFIGTGRIEVT